MTRWHRDSADVDPSRRTVAPRWYRLPAREWMLVIGVFLTLFAVAVKNNVPIMSSWNYHFGGEYGNIAQSIVEGDGFSSPFDFEDELVRTGPTAWMPPVYTYLLAGIFKVFGTKSIASVWTVMILKYLSLSIVALLVFRIACLTTRGNWPFLILPIFAFLIRYSFDAFFMMTHDIWIVALFTALILYSFQVHVSRESSLGIAWAVLGGVAVLVNPALGPVVAVLTFLPYTRTVLWKRFAVLAIVFAVISPWLVRNYVEFERVILVKSNLPFDLYQGNYLDDDGILMKQTFHEFHPHNNAEALNEYVSLGETAFMDHYRASFSRELRAHPEVFLRKIFNRCVSAFLVFPIFETTGELWGWTGKVKAITYTFPFLFSLFLLWQRRRHQVPIIDATILTFYVFLLPYLIVGFYGRYRIPLLAVFVLLYYYTAVLILREITPRRVGGFAKAAFEWFKSDILMTDRSA